MDVLVQLPLSEERRARLEAAAPGARFEYVKPRTVTREQVEAVSSLKESVHSLTISLVSFLPSDHTASTPCSHSRALFVSRVKLPESSPKKERPSDWL